MDRGILDNLQLCKLLSFDLQNTHTFFPGLKICLQMIAAQDFLFRYMVDSNRPGWEVRARYGGIPKGKIRFRCYTP